MRGRRREKCVGETVLAPYTARAVLFRLANTNSHSITAVACHCKKPSVQKTDLAKTDLAKTVTFLGHGTCEDGDWLVIR